MKSHLISALVSGFAVFVLVHVHGSAASAANSEAVAMPDFTKGDPIPEGADHDWNLGATGARGWMFCDRMVTSDARQIRVTRVDEGSPAEEVLMVGDVILGVGGKPFSHDPRTEFGRALTVAESEQGKGVLEVIRWRAGMRDSVELRLPVLGSYAATAPYDCPKSERILAQGCKALAERMAAPDYAENPISRSLNALALLASGEAAYLPLVRKEAEWASGFATDRMQTWYYGYVIMLLAEYQMATGDKALMPELRRLALESAKGQSIVGSWGHGFAEADGRLGGYGMMNAPGLPLTISLVLARAAGVKDPEISRAIERSARLLRFYAGKGAVPYGDHAPWIETHEDNGKCGMAAILFQLLDEAEPAEFFSRMAVASHGAERDTGHTGNFFNILWALPAVAQSGPDATGAWMREFGAWYFDLARRWDGKFPHQGPPEPRNDSYGGWDASGGYLLAHAMPLRKIWLTGRRASIIPRLDPAAAERLVSDGRGWNNKDRTSAYDALGEAQLVERLSSWSPTVRERAAMALGRRKEVALEPILALLESPAIHSRYGACEAVVALGGRGAAAVEPLRKALDAEDLWLRIKAAEALASIGAPAMVAVPEMLERLAQVDREKDPRGMQQRYFSFALFDGGSAMLGRSLEGVDRDLLYKAVRAGLANEDGRARGAFASVYRNLSIEEIRPLLPAVLQAVVEPAPSGEMFADQIRVEGLRVLARHGIEEGIEACVDYTRAQNRWASEKRTPELMEILLLYGTHAKPAIPRLREIATEFEKGEVNFPMNLSQEKAAVVRETIKALEASEETPELMRLR